MLKSINFINWSYDIKIRTMRGKISLILVLILLLSSCSSNQTSIEEEANEVENINTDYDSDEECLSTIFVHSAAMTLCGVKLSNNSDIPRINAERSALPILDTVQFSAELPKICIIFSFNYQSSI